MKLAIMQPYFFPYIGYWQLMNYVDEYVIYDNIQYTKKGFINRNYILLAGEKKVFTVPINKDSDFLDINKRTISKSFDKEKLLNLIAAAYKKTPYFEETYLMLKECILFDNENLFEYIYNSIQKVAKHLHIDTKLVVSSNLNANHELKGAVRVIDICKVVECDTYVNNISGAFMYDKDYFAMHKIELEFFEAQQRSYTQAAACFTPNLSIIDVMMNCGRNVLNNTNESEIEIRQIDSLQKLYELLVKFDNYITPSLSYIAGDFNLYTKKVWKNAQIFVAYAGETPVGLIAAYCNNLKEGIAFISFIAIEKKFQMQGIGKMLLGYMEKIAATKNMKEVKLEVYKDNLAAQKFYSKIGYSYTEEQSENGFFMTKQI